MPAWCHVPGILAPLPWGSNSTAEPFQVWLFLSTSDAPRASQWIWKPDGARGEDWYLWRWSHSVTLIFTFARAHFTHFKLKTKYIFPARGCQLLYTHSPQYSLLTCCVYGLNWNVLKTSAVYIRTSTEVLCRATSRWCALCDQKWPQGK